MQDAVRGRAHDVVFTNGSLHEWADPEDILNEIGRVLKPGGRYCISDLRRDMNPLVKEFLWLATGPKEMRRGLLTRWDPPTLLQSVRDCFP